MRQDRNVNQPGFTLVEMMMVIAIISILLAILLPTIRQVSGEADKALCGSQMSQWGVAVTAYANDNDGYFPDNRDGWHISWNSPTVREFFAEYLTANSKKSKTNENDVLNCPTQKWHQINDVNLTGGLIGYFYMPHRDARKQFPAVNYTWAEGGLGDSWVSKQRMFSPKEKTPILSDMLQQLGANWWHNDEVTPFSSHIKDDGEPRGGNFLFEDGHVAWYPRQEIGLGCTVGSWNCYYDIPIN